jgi:lipopolysaccharide export system permease protein
MSLLSRYIIRNFGVSFFPIFMALFVIASVVYFINIATSTAYLKVTFMEVSLLYFYFVPEILLYTMPIAFFAGAVMSLSRLSFDLEMIVIFALQGQLKHIMRALAIVATLMTVTLLIIGLWLKPKTLLKSKEMIYNKQDTAQLNIKPSEYGQKFGDWLLYVGSEDQTKKNFKDIVLFNKQSKTEIFVHANNAKILQSEAIFKLGLNDGDVYHLDLENKQVEQIRFNAMAVNEQAKISQLVYTDIIAFWKWWIFEKNEARELVFALLAALFPLLSLLLIVSIGIINPRYQKNRSGLYITLLIASYYGLTNYMGQNYPLYAVPTVLVLWLMLSYLLYTTRIKNTY